MAKIAELQTFMSVARNEYRIWGLLGVIVFFISMFMHTGRNIASFLDAPFYYSGDVLLVLSFIQSLSDGWLFDIMRLGYPFNASLLGYPIPDGIMLILIKLLTFLGISNYIIYNFLYLLGFSVVFIVAYVVMRVFRLPKIFAVCGAVLFAFLPFHFYRYQHLFLSWYAIIPIFFYYGYALFDEEFFDIVFGQFRRQWPYHIIASFIMASSGIYFAFFGALILSMSGIAGSIRAKSFQQLKVCALIIIVMICSIVVNTAPNIYNELSQGKSGNEVYERHPAGVEYLGLKITHLLMPQHNHRIEKLKNISDRYYKEFPLPSEGAEPALGLIGALGFVSLLLAVIFFVVSKYNTAMSRLKFFSSITLCLVLFSTIGGFATFFSLFVSSSLRGQNRVSIFIAFTSLCGFFLLLDLFLKYIIKNPILLNRLVPVILSMLFICGFYYQTSPRPIERMEAERVTFNSDKSFVEQIERTLPRGAAVYQLPYMQFPEVPPLVSLPDYGLAAGFVFSHDLRWSYGNMKFSDGDIFYGTLADDGGREHLEILKKMGFSGVYIDRRGYSDGGQSIEKILTEVLAKGGGPDIISDNKDKVFYILDGKIRPLQGKISPKDVYYKLGFPMEIFFNNAHFPPFVDNIIGVSGMEQWGRWSDANLHESVVISFNQPLPAKFTLHISAHVFDTNVGKPITVKVGKETHDIIFENGKELKTISFSNDEITRTIEIIPSSTASPNEINGSGDFRKLGIGLDYIKVIGDDGT